jgi:flagellar motor switch/type III secretory pathway protein FliN
VQSPGKGPNIRPFEFGSLDDNKSEGALNSLTEAATIFSRGLRRAIPFLARQRAKVNLGEAHPADDAALSPLADGPSFVVQLESPEQVWAALHFDSNAIVGLLDGLFGSPNEAAEGEEDAAEGAEEEERQSLGEALTLAQRALLKRLGKDIALMLRDPVEAVCKAKLSVTELRSLKRGEPAELPEDLIAIDCRIDDVPHPWAIRVCMGAKTLTAINTEENAPATDAGPTMVDAAVRVPVTVVAELGRVTLKLSQVLALRAGDTLRLPSAANDPVLVRVEGVPKFDAVPVISRGQVAVKIQSRHSE